MEITKETDFVRAFGKTPSGLFIVTAAFENQQAGYLASWVQQASFTPLVFSVACHPSRYPYQIIKAAKKFALNLIPEGDKILLKTFAKGHGPETNPFENIEHTLLDDVPVLKNAIASVVCEVASETQPGDHVLFFGEVKNGMVFDETKKSWVHLRQSALSY